MTYDVWYGKVTADLEYLLGEVPEANYQELHRLGYSVKRAVDWTMADAISAMMAEEDWF
jgi:hypothetical protein